MPIDTGLFNRMHEQVIMKCDELNHPCIVISQPMYFPWVGMLEQIRMTHTFVYYDDVQYSRGGFYNRVQVKTSSGMRWLTVPLRNVHLGKLICDVKIDNSINWRLSHYDLLRQSYAKAPYMAEMLKLVEEVFSQDYESLAELSKASTDALIDYFGLGQGKTSLISSALGVSGSSTQRVIDLCLHLNAKTYLTGHGARHYLEHDRFEAHDIDVVYMNYGLRPYPQSHGTFTPYVTALDLVAHCGKAGVSWIAGSPIPWREFVAMT